MLSDFPKLHCPFIRQTFDVDREAWKKHGSRLMLREPKAYLVVDKINPGYEWVFDDPDTFAVEKLDGTNVKLRTEGGRLMELQNRLNIIDPLQICKGNTAIPEAIFRASAKGYIQLDGTQAGEVIGPKLQGNPYHLDYHEWYPFDKAVKDLRYRSFHEHERNFANWSSWFQHALRSRYYQKRREKLNGIDLPEQVWAEGVIFYNLKRKAEGECWMAKLRRNMFDWYYQPDVPILGYTTAGRDIVEDQIAD